MHQIKCAGILGWKMFAQLISRHCPDFLFFFLHFFIAVFNVICFMFFAGRNTAGCSTKYILWILKKARRRRHFSVVGSSPKRLRPPILKIYATHLNKNNIYIYIVLFVLSLFYLLFCYQYYLKHVCLFSLFMFICVLFVFNILLFCIYIMVFWFHLFPLFFIFIYCFFIYIFLITIIIITIII